MKSVAYHVTGQVTAIDRIRDEDGRLLSNDTHTRPVTAVVVVSDHVPDRAFAEAWFLRYYRDHKPVITDVEAYPVNKIITLAD